MYIQRTATSIVVHTPAKLNLFLEVLARRPDGFHEIETLMTGISLFDTLTLSQRTDDVLQLTCNWASGAAARDQAAQVNHIADQASLGPLPANAQNIVIRALALLQQRSGSPRGADVRLVKRIPAAAGLGGASSDAAAALVAANEAWELGLSQRELAAIAAELGSDIPFFLEATTAMCRGRGERIEPLERARLHAVVVRPPEGLSTPAVFSHCRPTVAAVGAEGLQKALKRGDVGSAARRMLNGLQGPATSLSGWISRLEAEFARLDCVGHQMSGSGSSYFGICHHARHARRVAARLRARGLGSVFAVTTGC